MRCKACNKALNNYEATRKDCNGEFVDLCNNCYSYIAKQVISDKDCNVIENDISYNKTE